MFDRQCVAPRRFAVVEERGRARRWVRYTTKYASGISKPLTEKQIGLYGRQVCELNRHVQQPPSLPTALPRVVPWGAASARGALLANAEALCRAVRLSQRRGDVFEKSIASM